MVKKFREGDAEAVVLRGVWLDLPKGTTTSLVGASGSGKSTLLSLLAGLARPDAGTVEFDGQDIGVLDDTARDRLRGTRIGVVLQSGNLIPFLTALENVELAIDLSGRRRTAGTAHALLGELGLTDRLDHLPTRLSGGEVQRASIAMALANEPELLLADEVTGELDSSTAEQVMEIILTMSRTRGLTVLFVTHNADFAGRADHRLRLIDGEVMRE